MLIFIVGINVCFVIFGQKCAVIFFFRIIYQMPPFIVKFDKKIIMSYPWIYSKDPAFRNVFLTNINIICYLKMYKT